MALIRLKRNIRPLKVLMDNAALFMLFSMFFSGLYLSARFMKVLKDRYFYVPEAGSFSVKTILSAVILCFLLTCLMTNGGLSCIGDIHLPVCAFITGIIPGLYFGSLYLSYNSENLIPILMLSIPVAAAAIAVILLFCEASLRISKGIRCSLRERDYDHFAPEKYMILGGLVFLIICLSVIGICLIRKIV